MFNRRIATLTVAGAVFAAGMATAVAITHHTAHTAPTGPVAVVTVGLATPAPTGPQTAHTGPVATPAKPAAVTAHPTAKPARTGRPAASEETDMASDTPAAPAVPAAPTAPRPAVGDSCTAPDGGPGMWNGQACMPAGPRNAPGNDGDPVPSDVPAYAAGTDSAPASSN